MDSLNEFKKYVETKINSIAENNKLIEQSQNLVDKLENLYAFLTDKNYAGIDLNSFRDCLNFVFDGNDTIIINNINEAIDIIKDEKLVNQPQRPAAENYLNNINTSILTNINKLKENIEKIKTENDGKASDYREYSDLIKEGQIVRHLSDKDLKRFFEFLKKSSLDQNIVLDLTILFCKDSIDYAEKLRKLRDAKEEIVKKDNVAEVKKKIKEQNRVKVEDNNVEVPEVKFTLTEEENAIYSQVLDIMNVLTKDIELNHDTLVDLLNDDFSLESRMSIYDSTDDKFNLILEDLKVNLIPNFENNKNDIMTIFKYIIVLYNKEYRREEEKIEFVSQVADFSEEEKKEIEEYLEIANKEIEYYDSLDKKDKDMIESIRVLLVEDSKNKIEISPKFSLDYVKYITLIRDFYDAYNEYVKERELEEEYVKFGLQEDTNAYFVSQMSEIRDILRRLSKQYELINGKKEDNAKANDISIISQYTPDRKTLLVFLPLSDGDYSIIDDQQEVFDINKVVMQDVAGGLYSISRNDFYTYISNSGTNNKDLTPDKRISDYSKEVKPHRFRKGNARFAYAKLSLSAGNQEKIKEIYGVEKADVLLIIGCSAKMNDSSKVIYNDFNRRIAKEIDSIRYVFRLFSTDFDKASLEAATRLIDDSDKYCERLYKDPFRNLDDESLWR